MKLEEVVISDCLNSSCRPTLLRHVLSHLLFLVEVASNGRKKKVLIVEFCRPVAVDLLALYDVTENSEVRRIAPTVAA